MCRETEKCSETEGQELVHTHEHTHTHTHVHDHGHGDEHGHEHSPEFEGEHSHEHTHTHSHEHSHEESHENEHDHEHGHTHPHMHGEDGKDKNTALLQYMVDHNVHHAKEIADLAAMLRTQGKEEAAEEIEKGVEDFNRGNAHLTKAYELLN